MALSSASVGSELDVNNIVGQLMSIELRPLDQLDRREVAYQAQLSAYGNLRSALSSFQAAVNKFTAPSAIPGDSSILSASTTKAAQAGSYSVNVAQLAQAHALVTAGRTSATAVIGTGAATTLRFDFGTLSSGTLGNGIYSGATYTQDAAQPSGTVSITAANNSLEGIRNAINAANVGVTASIVKDGSAAPYRLLVQSAATGLARSLRITVTGDATLQALLGYDPAATQNLTQTAAAQDAQLSVNGVSISSTSNSVTDAIVGATLTLLEAGSTNLTIGHDSASAKAAIEAFVSAYNELNGTLRDLARFDPQTNRRGALIGDATLRTIQSQLRSSLSGALGELGSSNLQTLGQAGISLHGDGTLALDSGQLASALAGNPDHLAALFTTVGVRGYAHRLDQLLEALLSSSGPISGRTDDINRSIEHLDDQRASLERRLQTIEQRYRAQFAALDTLVSNLQGSGDFLSQQLAQLPGAEVPPILAWIIHEGSG